MANPTQSVVIVTGGASGIGLALAHAFGAHGATIVLADLDESALEKAVAELIDAGVVTVAHTVDLRDDRAVDDMVARATKIGTLTAACLNAGVTSTGSNVWNTPPDDLRFVMDVNLNGLANSLRSVVPVLIEQGAPADLVVTASMAGLVASPGSGAYAASKAAAIALTKAVRAELMISAPRVRVALLNPGMVKTNLLRNSSERLPQRSRLTPELAAAGHDALNALGVTPTEVAAWVLDALHDGRFWVLPPADDPFCQMLTAEIDELQEALAR